MKFFVKWIYISPPRVYVKSIQIRKEMMEGDGKKINIFCSDIIYDVHLSLRQTKWIYFDSFATHFKCSHSAPEYLGAAAMVTPDASCVCVEWVFWHSRKTLNNCDVAYDLSKRKTTKSRRYKLRQGKKSAKTQIIEITATQRKEKKNV